MGLAGVGVFMGLGAGVPAPPPQDGFAAGIIALEFGLDFVTA